MKNRQKKYLITARLEIVLKRERERERERERTKECKSEGVKS